jgi:hypothetical protein
MMAGVGDIKVSASHVSGQVGEWTLSCTLSFRYWVAQAGEGQGFPRDVAEVINARFRSVIRVMGQGNGDDLRPVWFKDGRIQRYHIDTPTGLHAFVLMVKLLALAR